jgi:hypothetical protein
LQWTRQTTEVGLFLWNEKYGMEMDKMTEPEAISLFSFYSEIEEKQVKLLAKNLDYLPLALSLAASYIKITHISVKEYNKNLLGSQLQAVIFRLFVFDH